MLQPGGTCEKKKREGRKKKKKGPNRTLSLSIGKRNATIPESPPPVQGARGVGEESQTTKKKVRCPTEFTTAKTAGQWKSQGAKKGAREPQNGMRRMDCTRPFQAGPRLDRGEIGKPPGSWKKNGGITYIFRGGGGQLPRGATWGWQPKMWGNSRKCST